MQTMSHVLHVALLWLVTGTNSQTVGAVLLVALVPLVARRSWKRADSREAELAAMSPEERAGQTELENRRGRRIEDLWTLGVASAAAYLSSTGLRRFGHGVMGLSGPYEWLPFFALDVAALICGRRARRRARSGKGLGQSGALMWVLACTSSAFSATEASDVKGTVARAVWPLIAMYLFELGSMEERSAHRETMLGKAGRWVDRRLQAVRLVHPIEWVRVALALASDVDLSQTEATLQVRIARAAYWVYKLRLFKRKSRPWLFASLRNGWLESRAQTALARVGRDREQLMAVLYLVQLRAKTGEFAGLEYRNQQQALRALQSMIGLGEQDAGGRTAGQPGRPGSGARLIPGQGERRGMVDITNAETGAPHPGTGEAVPAARPGGWGSESMGRPGTAGGRPAPSSGTVSPVGTAGPESAQRRPGTAEYVVSRQVSAGTSAPETTVEGASEHPSQDGAQEDPHGTWPTAGHDGPDTGGNSGDSEPDQDEDGADADGLSDAELVPLLLESIGQDGRFSTGGIGATSRYYRVGKVKAKRCMDAALLRWKAPREGFAEVESEAAIGTVDIAETLEHAAARQVETEALLLEVEALAGQSPR